MPPIDAALERSISGQTDLQQDRVKFAVGFHQIHPEVSLNYQMNRFSTGSADMISEMRTVTPRIRDYIDYVRELLALSERALQKGEKLNGAYYLRSAEFYMFPDDPRKQHARGDFIRLMREHFEVGEEAHHEVPYGSATLSTYRFTHPAARGTIVLLGGFDSYIEELFAIQLYLHDAGFDVITFEGPGQGAALEEQHLPMTPDWDKPVRAVLDYFQLEDVTLIGYSLGGCLAIRAAARERRVRRVVADDIFTDLVDVSLRQVSPIARATLSGLLTIGAVRLVNDFVERAMRRSLVVEWGVRQGMHVTGTSTPYDFFREAKRYRTEDISPLVEQDVLLLAGAEDHYVPLHQFHDQIRWLTSARSLTARLFTRQEQAQNHVHVGNVGLSLRVIADWITERQRRCGGSAAHSPQGEDTAGPWHARSQPALGQLTVSHSSMGL
jgi:alpha-beta hydrolase superfamily lysophospholipase